MKETKGFGERLRAARKAAGMTQKYLAQKIGAKHNSVSDWENNKNMPDPDTIVLLCEYLDVGASYLLNTEKSNDTTEFPKKQSAEVSTKALEIARAYEMMSDYGRAIVDFIVEQEEKRKRELFGKPKILSSGYKPIPMIQGKDDAELFMEYTSKQELMELLEETTMIKED